MIGLSHLKLEHTNYFFGSVLIAISIPLILLFLAQEGFKKPLKIPYFGLAILSIALGILIICVGDPSIFHMCALWGVYSLLLAIYTIIDSFIEIKHSRIEIIEIIICAVDIVFSILLIIRADGSVNAHLIFIGISFILKSVIYLLHYFFVIKKAK